MGSLLPATEAAGSDVDVLGQMATSTGCVVLCTRDDIICKSTLTTNEDLYEVEG